MFCLSVYELIGCFPPCPFYSAAKPAFWRCNVYSAAAQRFVCGGAGSYPGGSAGTAHGAGSRNVKWNFISLCFVVVAISQVVSAFDALSVSTVDSQAAMFAMAAALNNVEIGWRQGTRRCFIVVSNQYNYALNHPTSAADITSGSVSNDMGPDWLSNEQFPTLQQIRGMLLQHDALPMFLVTSAVRAAYDATLSEFGFGTAETLSANSNNIDAVVASAIATLNSQISLIPLDNTHLVSSISPAGPTTETGEYTSSCTLLPGPE